MIKYSYPSDYYHIIDLYQEMFVLSFFTSAFILISTSPATPAGGLRNP